MRRNEPTVSVSEGEAVMRVFLFGFAVALVCCCSAQEATAQSHPLAPLLPTNTSLGRVGLTRMWWGSATMDSKRDKLLYLALDDTHLFAHCSNGIICCFDAETGRKLWATALGGQDEPAYAPTSNHKYVIILSGSILFALKKETGDIAWQFPLEDGPTTPPVVDEDQVYFGTADGSMMAYNLEKLSDNFMKRRKAESAYRAFVFKYTIRTHILEPPVVLDKNVAFSGSGNHVTTYVLGQNRQLKYEFDTPEPLSCGLAAHNNMLVICSEDSQIYALNMITGGLRWQAVMGGPVTQTPRVVENDLYVSPAGVGLRRFDLRTGNEKCESRRRSFGFYRRVATTRREGWKCLCNRQGWKSGQNQPRNGYHHQPHRSGPLHNSGPQRTDRPVVHGQSIRHHYGAAGKGTGITGLLQIS
jgi:outer membrane protein assembly factor BamB